MDFSSSIPSSFLTAAAFRRRLLVLVVMVGGVGEVETLRR
jgi:hypothetical protein